MAFALSPLPYPDTALEPAVSAETLSFHYGKHHQTYLDRMNAAIDGTPHADASLEAIVAAARGTNQGLFNNARRPGTTRSTGIRWPRRPPRLRTTSLPRSTPRSVRSMT